MSAIEWTPWRKWWMDVFKWFLVTVAGFALTFGVFSRIEERRSEERALCASRVDGVRRALVQFDSAASTYRVATYNAFNELYRWRSEQPTEPIRNWWTVAYPAIDAALRSLESAYPAVRKETTLFRHHNYGAFVIIDGEFIDPRLDRIATLYVPGSDPTEEQRRQALRPIPRQELQNKKPQLDALLKALDETQTSIGSIVTGALSQPADAFCGKAK